MLRLLSRFPSAIQACRFMCKKQQCKCCKSSKKSHASSQSDSSSSSSTSSSSTYYQDPCFYNNNSEKRIPFIGELATPFKATVVKSESVAEETEIIFRKPEGYTILFFFPLAFTFVCPTELKELDKVLPTLEKGNHKVYGISVDSQYSLMHWLKTPQKNGGIQGLKLPLISDLNRNISTMYGVLSESGFAERATLIIDNKEKVRFINVNSSGIGRSTEDLMRIVDALESYDKFGEMCPANWKKGMKKITPNNSDDMKKFWEEFSKDEKKN